MAAKPSILMLATTCRRSGAEGALPLEPPCLRKPSTLMLATTCRRSGAEGALPKGAAHRLRSRRFSLQLKKKLCINPMQQLLF